jgi:hypothetical protein
MFIQINKSSDWDLGAEVAAHLLEIDANGKVLRLIQVDGVDHVIDVSPSEQDPYGAVDYPPLSMESDWSEWEISPAKFEAYWNREIDLRTTELSLSPCSSEPDRPSKKTNIIETIKEMFTKYPDVIYSISDNTVSIDPPSESGFTVWLSEEGNLYTVGFDGWHEEFEDEKEALNVFSWGLSNSCRLKVTQWGNKPCNWTAEGKRDSEWFSYSTTGLLFVPFWKKKSVEYKQNNLIKE